MSKIWVSDNLIATYCRIRQNDKITYNAAKRKNSNTQDE